MNTQHTDEKEILLNIMYTGSYLEDQNIGHEFINLFQADNGKHYIYVLPYGTMDKKHNDKISSILLVRRCTAKIFEIMAKAENLTQIIKLKTSKADEKGKLFEEQKKFIEKEDVKYGGVYLHDIVKKNINAVKISPLFITFQAEKVVKVKKPVYITVDKDLVSENCFYLEEIAHFPSQSPKMYISSEVKAYHTLNDIINDENKWSEEKLRKVEISDIIQELSKNNFIDIIKQGHDELVYSNLFQYIFNASKEGFVAFAQDVLGIKDYHEQDYIIKREEANIDLLIASKDHVIVIENKIKSGINGICEAQGENIDNNKLSSQLEKYYNYVKNNYPTHKQHYYVFTPNYNPVKLKKYIKGDAYTLITYSKILDFFKKNKHFFENTPYFEEFMYAIIKHIKNVDNTFEEEMYKKLITRILEYQKTGK